MHSKPLASREQAVAPGYKKTKERVNIVAFSNASETQKLPLVSIGKSAKPKATSTSNLKPCQCITRIKRALG